MKPRSLAFIVSTSLMAFTLASQAQGPAQWRGPERLGTYPGEGLATSWPAEGPALLWSADGLGKGYSSPVCDGHSIYVTGMRDTLDVLSCFSPDGTLRWQTPVGNAWDGPFPETRTTPTVDGDRVYTISGKGNITCTGAEDGHIRWTVDGLTTFGGICGTWGVCESPLIVDNLLFFTPAGKTTTLVALDKMTGQTVRMSEPLNDTTAYVSPLFIRHNGRGIVTTLTERWFFGVDLSSGKILWKFDFASLHPEEGLKIWPGAPRTNTNTPLYYYGMLYITGGYDHAGAMFRLSETGDSLTLLWVDRTLDCHHGGVVRIGEHIYGSNWINNNKGNWCCLAWDSGKVRYEHTWGSKGAIIAAGNMLYCFDEKNGTIGLVQADPSKFNLAGSLKITKGNGPFWAHPAIHGTRLMVRHGDALMVYDIGMKK